MTRRGPEMGEIPHELSGKEKFAKVLELFGTEKARERFLELCKRYHEIRGNDVASQAVQTPRGRTYSPPRRAEVHNQIMSTLQRLSLGKMDAEHRAILNEMAGRETTAQYLKEYLLAQGDWSEEDVEEERSARLRDRSDVAKFHMMGGEDY